MTCSRGFTVSRDFPVYAEIQNTQDYITFDVEAEYDVEADDPAYDPRSGNSLNATWRPTTYVEFNDVSVDWSEDTEDLKDILEKNGIIKDFTLLFSCDHNEGFKNGEDIRPSLTIPITTVDVLIEYKEDIKCICESFAEELDIDVDV